jgi:hypothetical protein
MKTLIIITWIPIILFISSCSCKTEAEKRNKIEGLVDTLNIGCLSSYDINPSNNQEKINKVYGKDQIKDGHWIIFGIAKNAHEKVNRVKLEDGYYRKNKKIGFWKLFNKDGTLKDSIIF